MVVRSTDSVGGFAASVAESLWLYRAFIIRCVRLSLTRKYLNTVPGKPEAYRKGSGKAADLLIFFVQCPVGQRSKKTNDLKP